jgi:hypothetical protein
MSSISPASVKNFPVDNPKARIFESKKNGLVTAVYVVERYNLLDRRSGKYRRVSVTIGRIVDNCYYTMEDYHSLFKRDGSVRTALSEKVKRPVARLRPTVRTKGKSMSIDRSVIKNLPEGNNITLCRSKDRLYVIKREYYVDENGKRKDNKHYLGQVVNNRFYTTQEYKEKFSKGVRMKRKALAWKNRQHAVTEEIR